MNIFDLVVLVVIVLFTLRGVMKGMVSQIVSVGSYLICWLVASRFAFVVAPSVPAEEPWNKIGAMVVLFVLTMIGIRFVHGGIEKSIASWSLTKKVNQLGGGALGFAKGILICMVLTFFGVMFLEGTRNVIFNSKSGLRLSKLIERTGAFVPGDTCKILRDQLDLYHAKVSGTPIDPSLEVEPMNLMLRDSLDSLREQIDENAANPNGNSSNQAVSSAMSELYERGNALLEQVQTLSGMQSGFQSGTNNPSGGVSLADGLYRWFSGAAKKETAVAKDKESLQGEIETLFQEANTYLQKTGLQQSGRTPRSRQATGLYEAGQRGPDRQHDTDNIARAEGFGSGLSVPPSTFPPISTAISSRALQDEASIRRASIGAEQLPSDLPPDLRTHSMDNPGNNRRDLSELLPQGTQSSPAYPSSATGLPFLDNLQRDLPPDMQPYTQPPTQQDIQGGLNVMQQQLRNANSQDGIYGASADDAMSIPSRAPHFRIRSFSDNRSPSSDHLLNSSSASRPTGNSAPAKLFSPSRLEQR